MTAAVLGGTGDGDAGAAAEFEEAFVAELAECARVSERSLGQ